MQLDRLRNEYSQPNTLIPYFTAYLIELFFIVILIHHPLSNSYIIFTDKKLRAAAENRLHFLYQHKKHVD